MASWQLPWGNLVVIDHGAEYKTYYAQLDSIAVERGQLIVRTQSIGKVGSTGHATSAHLHFEVGRRRCSASRSVSCCSRTSTLQGPQQLQYDVEPRSGRFLMIKTEQAAGAASIVVVVNWVEESTRSVKSQVLVRVAVPCRSFRSRLLS